MVDEKDYRKHPRYRQYDEAVEVALSDFLRASEWADLIQSLQRVKRTISSSRYEDLPFIPSKALITLAKRLAQCLNPGLPDGVHLKALEVYDTIFRRIDQSVLIKDLSLYSAGLFPLFPCGSTRVKPALLDLYKEFYIPLGMLITSSVALSFFCLVCSVALCLCVSAAFVLGGRTPCPACVPWTSMRLCICMHVHMHAN